MEKTWQAVDALLEASLLAGDEVLSAALDTSRAAGLPPIQVSPLQGKLLHLLARSIGATRMLEIGTLGGYSAIWLGRALSPGGRLTTLEREPSYAEVARANLARAGLDERVKVLVGTASETLPTLSDEVFDLTFIDADKASTADYFDWSVSHTRSGGVIVVDNVVRGGAVTRDDSDDANVTGIRRFLAAAGRDARVSLTALQTVGGKGYDGFALAVVE